MLVVGIELVEEPRGRALRVGCLCEATRQQTVEVSAKLSLSSNDAICPKPYTHLDMVQAAAEVGRQPTLRRHTRLGPALKSSPAIHTGQQQVHNQHVKEMRSMALCTANLPDGGTPGASYDRFVSGPRA